MEYRYHPLVTIIIPVYNGEEYMRYAIDSALAQNYDKVEVLVINDGSTDRTEQIALSYGDRIRYICKENGGVSTVLNLAIQEMHGEWLSWLSHDDVYLPAKVSSQVEQLNALLESGVKQGDIESYVLSCQSMRIDEKGATLPKGTKTHPAYSNKYELVAKEICNYSIGGCTVMASRKAYMALGGFDETNRTVSDTDMWFRMMLNDYRFVFSGEIHVQSRYHKGMVSIRRSDLVDKERSAFYKRVIEQIKTNLSVAQCQNIAIAMTRAGLDDAATEALSAIRPTETMKWKLTIAKLKRSIRAVLRTVYRKVRWG